MFPPPFVSNNALVTIKLHKGEHTRDFSLRIITYRLNVASRCIFICTPVPIVFLLFR
ncbi:hypothetical protein PAXRUDRAFT_831055 [Paxillus rubicundulus Ve08.2h10]|uniref:Uncharacterized protein n=1 Tax=Paxillus rubicundulus Ve08.2h10 TaxID=930991 RepID=A0A0D0E2R5_9AGAM|nr:hypothetical protein PAXRUDRAFT_831055 [Paxillus rubicundulus Ve08.2h10]